MSYETVPLHDAAFSLGQQVYTGWSTGDLKPTARSTAEAGWVFCDGAEYSQTAYPALYGAIGTTFNTGGETAGYFRVPNLAGRVPVGVSSTDGDFDLGDQSGAKTVTLTAAQSGLPAHTHTGSGGGGIYSNYNGVNQDVAAGISGTRYAATAANTAAAASEAHNNLQPGLAINWEIKL